MPCDLAFGHAGVAAVISVGIPLQAASAASLQVFASPPSLIARVARILKGTLLVPFSGLFLASAFFGVQHGVQRIEPEGMVLPAVATCTQSDGNCLVTHPLMTAGTNATIVATSTLSLVTPSSAAPSPSGHHSSGHTAAIAVPVVLAVALVACK